MMVIFLAPGLIRVPGCFTRSDLTAPKSYTPIRLRAFSRKGTTAPRKSSIPTAIVGPTGLGKDQVGAAR
jgi:hypothetical protein